MKKKRISKQEELRFLAQKSELECYFGIFVESIQLADRILMERKGIDNMFLKVDVLTWKSISSFNNGKINDGLESFRKGLATISSKKNLPVKALAKRKTQLLFW